jgi:hypothetical protein
MMRYLKRIWCALLNKRCEDDCEDKKPAKRGRPKKK